MARVRYTQQLLALFQGRPNNDTLSSLRKAVGCDGYRLPHGWGHLHIHPTLFLRGQYDEVSIACHVMLPHLFFSPIIWNFVRCISKHLQFCNVLFIYIYIYFFTNHKCISLFAFFFSEFRNFSLESELMFLSHFMHLQLAAWCKTCYCVLII